MKATLVFEGRRLFKTETGRTVVVEMDLYELNDPNPHFPYRFSWIAFDQESPEERVLFDCHPPKKPHFHLSDGNEETFEWTSFADGVALFQKKTRERFGELSEISDDGGSEE